LWFEVAHKHRQPLIANIVAEIARIFDGTNYMLATA